MRRLWWILVMVGCSSQPKPVGSEQPMAATGPTEPRVVSPPPAPAPPATPTVAEAPKSACEQDADSSECKCSQGVADSCFRLSDSEMRRGEHDVAIARVLGMCQNGSAQACFIGAKYLERLHIDARLGTSAKDLKARGVSIFEEKCKANDQATCVEYARLLLAGKYIAPDLQRGRALVEKACEAKQPRACLTLGRMYASGQGVKKDKKRAIALLEQSCTASGGAACTALAEQLPASQRQRVNELLTRACTDDDADACARIGAIIDVGKADGVLADVAAPLLMKACELDELKSCVRAGELAQAKDPVRARDAFERGCDGEVFPACLGLAAMIATGAGGPRNYGEGIALADKMCKLKAPKACDVAKRLRGSPPQVTCTTSETCEPLCEEQIGKACASLAQIRIKAALAAAATGGCEDALEPLVSACDLGDVGSCVLAGNEEEQPLEAARVYGIACAAKQAPACLLRDGALAASGTPHERARAITSLRRGCTAKDWQSCLYLGHALSVAKRAEAIKALEKACDGGVGRACRWLSQLIDTNPHWGIGDGSPSRFDAKLGKRVDDLIARACKLGDLDACVRAADERGEDVEKQQPPTPCGTVPRWAP
jgi:TPR repeat protein